MSEVSGNFLTEEMKERMNSPKSAIKVGPLTDLSFHQLRSLAGIFAFSQENLLRLRSFLCDGQEHVIAVDLYPDRAKALKEVLTTLQVEHDVVPSESVEWKAPGDGVRPSSDY